MKCSDELGDSTNPRLDGCIEPSAPTTSASDASGAVTCSSTGITIYWSARHQSWFASDGRGNGCYGPTPEFALSRLMQLLPILDRLMA